MHRGRSSPAAAATPTTPQVRDSHSRKLTGRRAGRPVQVLLLGTADSLTRRSSPTLPLRRSWRHDCVRSEAVAVEAWLAALRSQDPKVAAPRTSFVALREKLADWHRTESADSDPVSTCFRIVPPPEEPDSPKSPRLTSRKPPSRRQKQSQCARTSRHRLAHRVRPPGGRRPEPARLRRQRVGRRRGAHRARTPRAHPDEHLLKGLGRAARLVPSLGPALTAAEPTRADHRRRRRARRSCATEHRCSSRRASGSWRRPGGDRRAPGSASS